MQYLIYFGKKNFFQIYQKKNFFFLFSFRNMFAENIIQAALEQVKTTRGIQQNFLGFFFEIYKLNILVYTEVNGTTSPKVKFITRYVAGTNFLGSK